MVNKAILVGNLGKDPEVRYATSGTAVATFSVATKDRIPSKDGNWEERTEWHRVVAFGRLAEICGEYLHKGKQVYIEGRIQTREWQDRDGNKQYTTEIVANQMQMLGSQRDDGQKKPRPAQQQGPANDWNNPPQPKITDDDVPF